MASFTVRNGRVRALARRGGRTECATFATKSAAREWADRVEREIDELRSTGVVKLRGLTFGDLVDRYVNEFEPMKRWGRSKAADLARLKADLGHLPVRGLTEAHLTTHSLKRRRDGAGGVVIAAQLGYVWTVLKTARGMWRLDVPVQAAEATRDAFAAEGLPGKSQSRDRRVPDAEITRLVAHFDAVESSVPMGEIVRFAVASGMRLAEICRLRWDDLDAKGKTVIVRDRKDTRKKWGSNQRVPLLAATGFDAFAIVERQPRGSADRIFPVLDRTLSKHFTVAVAELGIDDLHFHDLRHEAISRLFAAGYRIEQFALVSGHKDWVMLRRHTHVRADDLHAGPTPTAKAPAKPKAARRKGTPAHGAAPTSSPPPKAATQPKASRHAPGRAPTGVEAA